MNRRTSLGLISAVGLSALAGCPSTIGQADPEGPPGASDAGGSLPLGADLHVVVDRIVDGVDVVLLLETEAATIGEIVVPVTDVPDVDERDELPVDGVELVLDADGGESYPVPVTAEDLET